MDPLSVTASVITLLATIQTAKESLEKIRRSLGAERLVLELLDEASDFQLLLVNVEAFVEVGALSAKAQPAVRQSLIRSTQVFGAFLEFVTVKLLTRTDEAGSNTRLTNPKTSAALALPVSGTRVSRTAWFLHEREVVKHRDLVRHARESLHFALTVANTDIHLALRQAISSSHISVQTELAAHSKAVDQIRTMVQQLSDKNVQRDRSGSASSDRTIRSTSSTETLLPDDPPGRQDHDGNYYDDTRPIEKAPSRPHCPRSCSCNCHSSALLKSPRWANQAVGFLLVRYSGAPMLTLVKCSKKRCRERHRSSIHASFYFPGWMLNRMVEIAAKWDSATSPKMNLRIMRVIPDSSPLFGFAMEGNVAGIRELFARNLASPVDIRASDGRSALHVAIYYGHVHTAQFLLDQNADREYKDKYFQSAVGACWEIFFQKLPIPSIDPCVIEGSTEDSDFLDERHLSPVHKIVLGISNASLGDYLCLSTIDINKRDVMGKTPLHFAAVRGDLDAVLTLLDHGADPNLTTDAQWTPLHEAAISRNHETIRPLLNAGAAVDSLNNRGQTALSLAAYVRDDPRYFDALLEFNTNIHMADKTGLTVLHRSSIRNRVKSAERLVALEADIDALDYKQVSPAHTCVINNSHGVLTLLLESGARVDRSAANGRTLLHDAAAVGDIKTILLLLDLQHYLERLDPDAVDNNGKTAQDIFNHIRHTCVSETDEERGKIAVALQTLLEELRQKHQTNQLAEKLLADLEVQSIVSDEDFFESMEKVESSVESLHAIMDGLAEELKS